MSYTLLNSVETVQVFSPTLVSEGLLCTIASAPSGSILIRTVPATSFAADQGQGLLSSLSHAVEDLISGGSADAATGTQGIDASGLLFDAVVFTTSIEGAAGIPGTITATVEIPVNVVTADTSFGGFLTGGSAAQRLADERAKLTAMATG